MTLEQLLRQWLSAGVTDLTARTYVGMEGTQLAIGPAGGAPETKVYFGVSANTVRCLTLPPFEGEPK